jgi:hypothetical protein
MRLHHCARNRIARFVVRAEPSNVTQSATAATIAAEVTAEMHGHWYLYKQPRPDRETTEETAGQRPKVHRRNAEMEVTVSAKATRGHAPISAVLPNDLEIGAHMKRMLLLTGSRFISFLNHRRTSFEGYSVDFRRPLTIVGRCRRGDI